MSDGAVTPDEEHKLAQMAPGLGLTHVEALAVRDAVDAASTRGPVALRGRAKLPVFVDERHGLKE